MFLKPLQPITVFKTSGKKGMLFLTTFSADSASFRYLEACWRLNIDNFNANKTVMLSSGTEDYFLSAFYFNVGTYHGDEAGRLLTFAIHP